MVYSFDTVIKGVELRFKTEDGVFSPSGIDKGTLAMLSQVVFSPGDRVLDLGCGYGVVGILAAKLIGSEQVVMLDRDPLAVRLARENAALNGVPEVLVVQSNGFSELEESEFTKILSNPPYHTDFSVPKHFVEKGFNRLVLGGEMFLVVKRRKWYQNKLISIFGGVQVKDIDGYFVLRAEKRSLRYGNKNKG
ncbi:MAG: class I SAM-dependent methyltransferase [Firmicutes bacterium]|jgi:16S rRNA (guanine1207-N2)-methyltransferase|nr:methyltransferase [Bacillota bacterium]NLO65621.1 class I SAM-dependent methyltransferase [Bacillota bacterium]